MIDEPVGLWTVVVGQDVQFSPEALDSIIVFVVVTVPAALVPSAVLVPPPALLAASIAMLRPDARDIHRLRASCELPEQLVASTEWVGRARRGLGHECVLEFDPID